MAATFKPKTGIVIVAALIAHACKTLHKYRNKLNDFIDHQLSLGHISSSDKTLAMNTLDAIELGCSVLQLLASLYETA